MGLLPSRVLAEPDPDGPRVLDVDGADADRAFDALSSETARTILQCIYEEPRTPTEVREEVGTSLQNVHYHLDKLEDADLIEPAGTGYSEKGNEMTVYAPASEAVVLFAGREHDRSRLRDLLDRVLVLYLVLAVATIALKLGLEALRPEPEPATFSGQSTDYQVSTDSGAASQGPVETVVDAAAGLDPALAFFLGGLVTIAALTVVWYVRER
jgi:DNA-binding transcriptional ArsR family regulator